MTIIVMLIVDQKQKAFLVDKKGGVQHLVFSYLLCYPKSLFAVSYT